MGSNFKDNNFKNFNNKSIHSQLKGNDINNCVKVKKDSVNVISSNHINNSSVNSSNNTLIQNSIPVYNMFDVLYPECEELIDDVFSDNDADQRDSEVGSQQSEASSKTSISAVLST
jgi:hypothetical protein